jgi:hypothetical protein
MIKKRFVWRRMFIALALVSVAAASAVADEGKDERQEKRRSEAKDRGHWGYDAYFHEHGYTTLGIPPGHLPPPGKCRLWYPDRPPGHQPPPESCGHVHAHVPAGAWLIHRPNDEPQYVDVSVYDTYQPGIVITIGLFDVDTGAFIRHLRPR